MTDLFSAQTGRAVQHEHKPLVHGARLVVECIGCGFRTETEQSSRQLAIDEIAARHRCAEPSFEVEDVNPNHPLFLGCRCRKCRRMEGRNGV